MSTTTERQLDVDLGDLFTGPLDLLLYLVRRSEVDVTLVPMARVTRRFAEIVEALEFLDLDFAGENLVIAATLAEIKSRLVLPQPEEEPDDDEAVADLSNEGLVKRLLLYKRYRDAAARLDERAAEWRDRFPRLQDDRPAADRDHAADRIRDVELWDLVSALGRILRTREVPREGRVKYDETPIHVHVERIGAAVRASGRSAFSGFFEGTRDRHRIVGLFLAILELVRHHGFRAEQRDGDPEIWILPPLEPAPSTTTTAPVEPRPEVGPV